MKCCTIYPIGCHRDNQHAKGHCDILEDKNGQKINSECVQVVNTSSFNSTIIFRSLYKRCVH